MPEWNAAFAIVHATPMTPKHKSCCYCCLQGDKHILRFDASFICLAASGASGLFVQRSRKQPQSGLADSLGLCRAASHFIRYSVELVTVLTPYLFGRMPGEFPAV